MAVPVILAVRLVVLVVEGDRVHQREAVMPVEMGGEHRDQPGLRAVPTLRYLQSVPAFTEHYYDSEDEGDESVDNGPTGGLTWDGRVDHGADQAKIPLLSPFEMGDRDVAEVVAKLQTAAYADDIKAAFGETVFDNPKDAFDAAAEALATFEQSGPDFYPYSSRYDAFLAGRATLTAQELHVDERIQRSAQPAEPDGKLEWILWSKSRI